MIKLRHTALILLLGSICHAEDSPSRIISALLDAEKFEEARKYATEKRITEYWGPKTIAGTEKCAPILNECAQVTDDSQAIRSCLARMEKSCDDRYLTAKWQNTHHTLINKLHDLAESVDKKPKGTNACKDGMKWGYIRVKKADCTYCAWSLKQDPKKLHGEFKSRDECEEKRLLDSEWATEQCAQRYLGDDKRIEVYESQAMVMESGQTISLHLKFKTLDRCKKANSEGMKYIDPDGNTFNLGKLGSKSPARFISECKKKSLMLCAKYDQDTRDTGDLL